jgi:predicted nucleic acid-binding Zn ribbon protein
VRCPYCGQLTTGTERRISKLELDIQRRERLAERRGKNFCRLCNKSIAANHEICSACEAKDRRNRVMLIAFLAAVVLLVLWYFFTSF